MLKPISIISLIVWLSMLVGCEEKKKEQDRTLTSVQQARQELERVKAIQLKNTEKIDSIEAELSDILRVLDKNESKHFIVEEAYRKLDKRLKELTIQQDTTVSEVTRKLQETNQELNKQLRRREGEFRQLRERMKNLEEIVKRIKK